MRASVDAEARRARALERDRMMRRERRPPSLIEQEAEAWKKREEAPTVSLETVIAEKQARQREAKESDPGWGQYHPWGGEEENRKPQRLNAASIWVFARRIMAREWALALGKKRVDPRLYALEWAAEEWKRKGEDEVRKGGQNHAERERVRDPEDQCRERRDGGRGNTHLQCDKGR